MPQNPIALLDEATSPKAIGVKSTGFQEVKKISTVSFSMAQKVVPFLES
jgi:hypothetical protein